MTTDHEFQRSVTGTLARLETKMDLLVGEDGNGGWKEDMEDRMRILEKRKNLRAGALGVTSAMIGGTLDWVAQHLLGKH